MPSMYLDSLEPSRPCTNTTVGKAVRLSCQWQNPSSWVSDLVAKKRGSCGIAPSERSRGQYRGTRVIRCALRRNNGGSNGIATPMRYLKIKKAVVPIETTASSKVAPRLVPVTNREFCLCPIEAKAPGLLLREDRPRCCDQRNRYTAPLQLALLLV